MIDAATAQRSWTRLTGLLKSQPRPRLVLAIVVLALAVGWVLWAQSDSPDRGGAGDDVAAEAPEMPTYDDEQSLVEDSQLFGEQLSPDQAGPGVTGADSGGVGAGGDGNPVGGSGDDAFDRGDTAVDDGSSFFDDGGFGDDFDGEIVGDETFEEPEPDPGTDSPVTDEQSTEDEQSTSSTTSTTEPTSTTSTTEPPPTTTTSTSTTTTSTTTTSTTTTSTTTPPTTTTTSSTTTTPTSTSTSTTVPSTTSTSAPTTTTTSVVNPERIAFTSARDGNQEIYSVQPDGGDLRRLTNSPSADRDAAWSPDGSKLAFVSDRTGRPEVFAMRAEGTQPERLTNDAGSPARPAWGRGGESVHYESTDPASGSREIYRILLADRSVQRLTSGACAPSASRTCPHGEIAHRQPAVSPDGSKIAYVRGDAAGQHVFVMNADGSQPRRLGGSNAANPAWSRDGQRIAFDDGNGVRVVGVNGDDLGTVPGARGSCPATERCPELFEPTWSRDGSRLAVRDGSTFPDRGDLYLVDVNGSGKTRIAADVQASNPRWYSPTG